MLDQATAPAEQTTITWTIEVTDLETRSRVGIWDHEQELQPVRANITLHASTAALPGSIRDCLDYQPICNWINNEWPTYPHTPLLETRLAELMTFIFSFDKRVEWVDAALAKPNAIRNARGAGVRLALTRLQFEISFGQLRLGSS